MNFSVCMTLGKKLPPLTVTSRSPPEVIVPLASLFSFFILMTTKSNKKKFVKPIPCWICSFQLSSLQKERPKDDPVPSRFGKKGSKTKNEICRQGLIPQLSGWQKTSSSFEMFLSTLTSWDSKVLISTFVKKREVSQEVLNWETELHPTHFANWTVQSA